MIKLALSSFAIAFCIGIACFICFLAGLYNAPRPSQQDEMDHLQTLCDLARKEPWKQEIKTSCEFMQEFWAIDYKCEKVVGCYTTRLSNGENRY